MNLPKKSFSMNTESLEALLATPLCAMPTCLFVTRNVECPFTNTEVAFFAGDEVDFFGMLDQLVGNNISASRGMQPKTFSPSIPYLMLGACFYGYHEPIQWAIDGNHYGPQATALFPAGRLPASPAVPINTVGAGGRLTAYGLNTNPPVANFFAHMAQMEWGGPTLKGIYAYLRSYRLQLLCSDNNYSIVFDELLADIGMCCASDDFIGYGNPEAAWTYYVRRVNNKLKVLQADIPTPGIADGSDPGYFYPVNCLDDGDELTPFRTPVRPASFGQEEQEGQIVPWQRLPFPVAFEPNDQVYLILVREGKDGFYRTRFVDEVTVQKGVNPNPDLAPGWFPEGGSNTWNADGTPIIGTVSQIPGGQMRFGLGIKGFQVSVGVARAMKSMLTCGPASNCPPGMGVGVGHPGLQGTPSAGGLFASRASA